MTEHVDSARIAEILPYTRIHIVRLAKEGVLPATQLVNGGKWIFDEAEVRRWYEKRKIAQWQSTESVTKTANRPAHIASGSASKGGRSTSQLRQLLGI
jgi:excisionase family DNA binding protein